MYEEYSMHRFNNNSNITITIITSKELMILNNVCKILIFLIVNSQF